MTQCSTHTEYQAAAATVSGDAVCTTATVCDAPAGVAYELVPLRRFQDRICAPLTVCSDIEVEDVPATPTTDRQCGPRCPAGHFQLAPSGYTTPTPGTNGTAAPPPPPQCYRCQDGCTGDLFADVVLALDASGSVEQPAFGGQPGNFDILRQFFATLVQRTRVAADGTRATAISFSTYPRWPVQSFSTNVADVVAGINAVPYTGGASNVALALRFVRTNILPVHLSTTAGAHALSGTPSAPRALQVILLTDGEANDIDILADEAFALRSEAAMQGVALKVVVIIVGTAGLDYQTILRTSGVTLVSVASYADLATSVDALDLVHRATLCVEGCPTGSYVSQPCTATTDRHCTPVTPPCVATETAAPTLTSDRVCEVVTSTTTTYVHTRRLRVFLMCVFFHAFLSRCVANYMDVVRDT